MSASAVTSTTEDNLILRETARAVPTPGSGAGPAPGGAAPPARGREADVVQRVEGGGLDERDRPGRRALRRGAGAPPPRPEVHRW